MRWWTVVLVGALVASSCSGSAEDLASSGTTSEAVAPDPSGPTASQATEDAARDGVVDAVAALTLEERLGELIDVAADEGRWVLSCIIDLPDSADASGALGTVPPVANTTDVDEEIAADIVVGEPRVIDIGPALSNSFAFGGHNVSLVVTPAEGAAELLADRWGVS